MIGGQLFLTGACLFKNTKFHYFKFFFLCCQSLNNCLQNDHEHVKGRIFNFNKKMKFQGSYLSRSFIREIVPNTLNINYVINILILLDLLVPQQIMININLNKSIIKFLSLAFHIGKTLIHYDCSHHCSD